MIISSDADWRSVEAVARKNIKLNIITLSLYRFWARTNLRKFLWSSTRIDDEPLEYSGTGDELFRGFWIALLLIFGPLWFFEKGMTFVMPIFLTGLITSIVYTLGMAIIGIGIWRARAYLLSRTKWRAISFSLNKGALSFGFAFLGHAILLVLTLGWWLPEMRMRVASRIWNNTKWGNLKFTFDRNLSHENVYGSFAIGWLGTIFLYYNLTLTVGKLFYNNELHLLSSPAFAAILGYAFSASIWVIFTLCFSSYRAAILRKIISCIEIGGIKLTITINDTELLYIIFKNAILNSLTFGLATPYTVTRYWEYISRNIHLDTTSDELESALRLPNETNGKAEGVADAFELPFFDMSPV